jgi:Phage capsid family
MDAISALIARAAGRPVRPMAVSKAAVSAMGSEAALVPDGFAGTEFFESVRWMSMVNNLEGLRQVPLNVRVVTPQRTAEAFWVAEGQAKPLTSVPVIADFLPPKKIMGVAVVTKELLNSADPAAEKVIRGDLARALSDNIDAAFLDPTNAGDNATPAAVTNGIAAIPGTPSPDDDLTTLIDQFEGDFGTTYFVMSPRVAISLVGSDRAEIRAVGGRLLGLPVIVSRNSPGGQITLIDAAGIAYGEGDPEYRIVTAGSVVMVNNPTMAALPTPTAAQVVGLWQTNATALVVGRHLNWKRVRPGAVSLITGTNY